MNDKNTTTITSGNPMSGIYGMLLEVLQSITSASNLHDLLTGAFGRLRWIVNLDYCSTSFYRKGTDDMRQGVIISNSIVDKAWKWEKNQILEDKILLATQSKSKVFIESKGNENNLFNLIFDEHQSLQQILCFTLPVVDKETAFIIIATRQENFEAQALNILNVFMEFLAVNIAKQRYTEDLDHALLTLENTQDQLIESEKMRALNSLVTGVAHEINTPLGVAITASSNLSEVVASFKTEYDNNQVTRTSLEGLITNIQDSSDILVRNLHRSSELVQNFKLISADQSSEQKRQFELKTYLDELIHSLKSGVLNNGHTITVESNQKINLNSFPGLLGQIMTNLILNSVQHGFQENKQGNITIKLLMKNEYVHIDYKDDGQGLNTKQRDKVFEPFFTTARFTGGAGLGMSISYNLVTAALNGKIHCIESEKGAHFIISFPAELKSAV